MLLPQQLIRRALQLCISLSVAFLLSATSERGMAQGSTPSDFQSRWEEWNQRRSADIEAARLNLQNARQELLNAGIYVNLQLKMAYLNAYQNYVSVYTRYLTSLSEKYNQQDATRRALMWSVGQVKRFQSQSNICTSMTKRMWQRALPEAVEDNMETLIYVGSIGRTLRAMAAKDHGEECLFKVLLENEGERRPVFGVNSELLSLRYINKMVDPTLPSALICPADNSQLVFHPETDSPADAYPLMPAPSDASHSYYYVPFTYYQLYMLLADQSSLFEIASAPASTAPLCDIRNPVNNQFYAYSHTAEASLAPSFSDILPGQVTDGLFIRELNSAHGNRAYLSLINHTKTIFEKIHACIQGNTQHLPVPPPIPGDQGFDPSVPSMSQSLKQCFEVAETYRQLAFSNEEIVAQIIRTLAEAQIDPPKEPSRPDVGPLL